MRRSVAPCVHPGLVRAVLLAFADTGARIGEALALRWVTPIKWIQAQVGWSSAKLLLDWYGHFLPSEQHGYADALEAALDGAQTAPSPL